MESPAKTTKAKSSTRRAFFKPTKVTTCTWSDLRSLQKRKLVKGNASVVYGRENLLKE